MDDINLASKLLGYTKQQITELIYIRKGQEVEPLERKGRKRWGNDLFFRRNIQK